jgi:hypothetical protein
MTKNMKTRLLGIIVAVSIFFVFQMLIPFPYGLTLGIGIAVVVIYVSRKAHTDAGFLTNYRRTDAKTEKEKEQNKEAFRILKKKYIEEKISKEEYDELKKEFKDLDDED